MDKYLQPLFKDNYYHIYNRTNNNEPLFYENDNYTFFLKILNKHLEKFINLYAYCLMPNHFHLLIKVVNEKIDLTGLSKTKTISITQAFSNLFNSYSKAINKQENRYGNLFQRPFKRIRIKDNSYIMRLVCYIHQNPLHHGYVKDISRYRWSSYYEVINDLNTIVDKEELLNWFGGKKDFISVHCGSSLVSMGYEAIET